MINISSLAKTISAYKILQGEKQTNSLSHAYLFVGQDDYLGEFVKEFALLIASEKNQDLDRLSARIQQGTHPDVIVYPKVNDTVSAEEAVDIVRESFIVPIELSKKIFIINNFDNLNLVAQNKLLKTLEEPPKNVFFLLSAKAEYSIIQTIISRVKKFEIAGFKASDLMQALNQDYDQKEIERAVSLSNNTLGSVLEILSNDQTYKIDQVCLEVICDMQKSPQILAYSNKINALSCPVEKFLAQLESRLRDLLCLTTGQDQLVLDSQVKARLKDAVGFKSGSVIHALECIVEANKRLKFNANGTATIEWLLFQILEGKYKWRKL